MFKDKIEWSNNGHIYINVLKEKVIEELGLEKEL